MCPNSMMEELTFEIQGPVVQSVVSLTSSLRVFSLTVLADSIYNILIFFAEKNVSSFCITYIFFSKKVQHICVSLHVNFNESLTNDIVSFEQLGPGVKEFNSLKTGDWQTVQMSQNAVSDKDLHCLQIAQPFKGISV